MTEHEKLAYLQGFLIGIARQVGMLPALVQSGSSDALSVCAQISNDCIAAARVAGPGAVDGDGVVSDTEDE